MNYKAILYLIFLTLIPSFIFPEKGVITRVEHKIKTYVYAKRYIDIAENFKLLEDSIITPIEKHFQRTKDSCFTLEGFITSDVRPKDFKSDHSKGKAIDIDIITSTYPVDNFDIYRYIRDSLEFDQMVIYNSIERPTHVHIGYRKGQNRNEILLSWRSKYRRHYKKIN